MSAKLMYCRQSMIDAGKGKCTCSHFLADYDEQRTAITFNAMHVIHNITHCEFVTKHHKCTNEEAMAEFAIEEL